MFRGNGRNHNGAQSEVSVPLNKSNKNMPMKFMYGD